jgi:putative acetyltransferase
VSDDLEIRDLRPEDHAAVRALILAGLRDHWGELDETLNPDLDDLAASYRTGRTLVVVERGRIIGTGTVVPRDGEVPKIVRMSVDDGSRRLGVGRRIVDALLATARAWGATAVVLETTAAWDEVVAFYVRCGFRVTHHEEGAFGRDAWLRCEL